MKIKNFDPYDFSKKEIDGVPIYYKNLPWAPCIHIRVVFNTGAFDDPIGKEGLSHFLEHMIFDGSPTLPDKKAIEQWKKLHTLDTWNAWTSFDNTCYWLKCLPEEYSNALSGMKDMIFNSFLRTDDIEHERKVIIQEAWGRLMNEKYLKYCKEFLDNTFHGNDRARFYTAIGWPDTVEKISEDDLKLCHKNNYGIGNFFIVLAGAVEERHVNMVKDFLKDLPKANRIVRNNTLIKKPKEKRVIKKADDIGIVREQVSIEFSRAFDFRSYAENEIEEIFGELAYDILYERLRIEKSICYGVGCSIIKSNTYSQVGISVKTSEKNINIAEEEFTRVLDEIKNKKHTKRFDIIKQTYIGGLKAVEFTSGNVADNSLQEISRYSGHVITHEAQIRQAENVTYDDVVEFVKFAFDPEYIYTEIILPSKK